MCEEPEFSVEGRAFTLSLVCPKCRLVMCCNCAGRVLIDGITALCCYNCQSTSLRDADLRADRLTSPGRDYFPEGGNS
jgi:hypothetical protein